MHRLVIQLFFLAIYFFSLSCLAIHIVNVPFTSSIFPTLSNASLPEWVAREVKNYPGYGFARQIDQNLMNEFLQVVPSILELEGYCRVIRINPDNNNALSYGTVAKNDVQEALLGYHSLLTHVVCDPFLKIGAHVLSMGTKLRSGGNTSDGVFICLPNGENHLVLESALWPLRDLISLSEEEIRTRIIQRARLLVGYPYQWGGRTALENSGFDCSGLINIAYLTCGFQIKRDVVNLWYENQNISHEDLKPGDLLFTLKNKKDPIHVVMWTKNNTVIEASPIADKVREASIEVVYGKSFDQIKNGDDFYQDEAGSYSVTFRRIRFDNR